MKIASWNVNSLRARLGHVLDWLESNPVEVLAVQETKLQDPDFPRSDFEAAGYHAVFSGQKSYNGVALLCRSEPGDVVMQTDAVDCTEKRLIAATMRGVRVVNLYVVNGSELGSDKYAYKLKWLRGITAFVRDECARYPHLAVVGDFNITPSDADVHDPAGWRGNLLCSEPERAALADLLALGLVDSFRLFEQPADTFSWWDYRGGGFRRNQGLRIDLVLASRLLAERCLSSMIDRHPRSLERPSDHAPVVADFLTSTVSDFK